MRAFLVPLEGGNPIEVQKDLMLVGRRADCDLRLDHKSISKVHCVLVKNGEDLLLRDLGSTNGCRVNGHRIKEAALRSNDRLMLAGLQYRVFLDSDNGSSCAEPEAQPPSGATEFIHMDQLDAELGARNIPPPDEESRPSSPPSKGS